MQCLGETQNVDLVVPKASQKVMQISQILHWEDFHCNLRRMTRNGACNTLTNFPLQMETNASIFQAYTSDNQSMPCKENTPI